MLLGFGASSCKQERRGKLSIAQVHSITQELAKAAAEARGTAVRTRKGRPASGESSADNVYIELRGDAAAGIRLRQALHEVATQHRLTVDAETARGNHSEIVLRSGGIPTHRIEIELLPKETAATEERSPSSRARLAILLDDLGSDRNAADAIFALHVPITLSVLPFHDHSREIAEEARKRGCGVMLHLPMQSLANESPEKEELRPGLSQAEVEAMVERMLEAVPEADGVNNHQGSQATANAALMEELMPVLRDAGMFYVDSRTTAATVAYDTAKRDGLKAAFRNVPFLDDVREKPAIKRQLQSALRGAREKGVAIAIGHPHPETLEALRELLPEARKAGVRLVLISDVVR
jgi:polysaccharide deacetylase 2 family uncharacterized protein YibQ